MKTVLVFRMPPNHAEQPPVTLDENMAAVPLPNDEIILAGNIFTISKRTFRYFPGKKSPKSPWTSPSTAPPNPPTTKSRTTTSATESPTSAPFAKQTRNKAKKSKVSAAIFSEPETCSPKQIRPATPASADSPVNAPTAAPTPATYPQSAPCWSSQHPATYCKD